MATATKAVNKEQETIYAWEGKDKSGKILRGEMRAGGDSMVRAMLRRQGIMVSKVKKRGSRGGGAAVAGTRILSVIGRQGAGKSTLIAALVSEFRIQKE